MVKPNTTLGRRGCLESHISKWLKLQDFEFLLERCRHRILFAPKDCSSASQFQDKAGCTYGKSNCAFVAYQESSFFNHPPMLQLWAQLSVPLAGRSLRTISFTYYIHGSQVRYMSHKKNVVPRPNFHEPSYCIEPQNKNIMWFIYSYHIRYSINF